MYHKNFKYADKNNDILVPIENIPCRPSPCGPYSQCRAVNDQSVCSCLTGYRGTPPSCRPECVVNSDCSLKEACNNQKCRDPCPGTCGVGARCEVINHNPICSCPSRYTGDPFTRCHPLRKISFILNKYSYKIITSLQLLIIIFMV